MSVETRSIFHYSGAMLRILPFFLICLHAALLFGAGVTEVDAKIYRSIDAQGRQFFTNVPTTPAFKLYRAEDQTSQLNSLIRHYADLFRLDAALIKAVIKVESNFQQRTVSRKGAQGLMQLMPETAREVGVTNPFDPAQNLFGGSLYLRKMLDSFDLNLDHALAAYNAGPGTVRRYGGIPPYEETRAYVHRVKSYLNHYRQSED